MTRHGDTPKGDILSVTAAARRLKISVRTVQRRLDSGELRAIQHDGKRQVLFSPDATADATTRQDDAPKGDSVTRQDTTERDTAQAGSTPDLAAQLTQSREEIHFLRGLVEQHQRSEAELRAALRKSLDAMPRALPESGSTPDVEKSSREVPPEREQREPNDQTPAASTPVVQRRESPRRLTGWRRVAKRILKIP